MLKCTDSIKCLGLHNFVKKDDNNMYDKYNRLLRLS